jgi:hypothetical protein
VTDLVLNDLAGFLHRMMMLSAGIQVDHYRFACDHPSDSGGEVMLMLLLLRNLLQ